VDSGISAHGRSGFGPVRSLALKDLPDVEVGPSDRLHSRPPQSSCFFTWSHDATSVSAVSSGCASFSSLKAPDVLLERAAMAEDFLRNPRAEGLCKPSTRPTGDRRHGGSLPTHLSGHTRPTSLRSKSTPRALHRRDSMGSKQLGVVSRKSSVKWPSLWDSRIATRLQMHAAPGAVCLKVVKKIRRMQHRTQNEQEASI
jgi:hypothetical protein